jgi:hypothetical protein
VNLCAVVHLVKLEVKHLRLLVSLRLGVAHGEAVGDLIRSEASDPLAEHPDTGFAKSKAGTGGLLEKALTRENLQAAWKRVKANMRGAGVDGLDIEQTAQAIRTSWPQTRLVATRWQIEIALSLEQPRHISTLPSGVISTQIPNDCNRGTAEVHGPQRKGNNGHSPADGDCRLPGNVFREISNAR